MLHKLGRIFLEQLSLNGVQKHKIWMKTCPKTRSSCQGPCFNTGWNTKSQRLGAAFRKLGRNFLEQYTLIRAQEYKIWTRTYMSSSGSACGHPQRQEWNCHGNSGKTNYQMQWVEAGFIYLNLQGFYLYNLLRKSEGADTYKRPQRKGHEKKHSGSRTSVGWEVWFQDKSSLPPTKKCDPNCDLTPPFCDLSWKKLWFAASCPAKSVIRRDKCWRAKCDLGCDSNSEITTLGLRPREIR
jgi:hypothetical protein